MHHSGKWLPPQFGVHPVCQSAETQTEWRNKRDGVHNNQHRNASCARKPETRDCDAQYSTMARHAALMHRKDAPVRELCAKLDEEMWFVEQTVPESTTQHNADHQTEDEIANIARGERNSSSLCEFTQDAPTAQKSSRVCESIPTRPNAWRQLKHEWIECVKRGFCEATAQHARDATPFDRDTLRRCRPACQVSFRSPRAQAI